MTDEAWIDTVRLARDMGSVEQLIPAGCAGLLDLPTPLFNAIRTATVYLGFEELPEEDRPPRKIWQRPRELHQWFADVKARYKTGDSSRNIEDPVSNQAARDLIAGG